MATQALVQTGNGVDERAALQNGFSPADESGSEDGKYVTEAVYWAEYYEHGAFNYEWNNGILEEKPVGDYGQFQLYLWFMALLKDFLHVNPIARMIGLEMGFRMILSHKTTIRKPDLAVVLDNNPLVLGARDRSYKGIFDLCIESISDSNKKEMTRDTVTKKNEYAAAGVKEYYILDEQGRETSFYRLGASGIYEPIPPQAGIIRSSVLPGFQWRVSDLYRRPEPPQMIADSVYSAFASPYFRAERLRADEERTRADEERIRADEERTRADEERIRADEERIRADEERTRADKESARANEERIRADEERTRAEQEKVYARQVETKLLREQQRAERYAAQLKALGLTADDLE